MQKNKLKIWISILIVIAIAISYYIGGMNLFGGKKKTNCNPADIYLDLRQQVFDLPKNEAQFGSGERLAVLMETGLEDACYSLIAVSDGSASLYFSNGGGIIGAGQHQQGAQKAKEFLDFSKDFESKLKKVSEYPLPSSGMIRFYVIKKDGAILSGEFKEDDLGNQRSSLSPLFHKGHELITIIRMIDERKSEAPLIISVWDNDIDAVRQLLESGNDPNTTDSKGLPALASAVSSKQEEIVDLLLSKGADPRIKVTDEEKDIKNAPIANFAASNGNVAILKMLLDSGADVEDGDESGLTPLMSATYMGNVQTLEYLIKSGSQLERKDSFGYTALMFAANAGQYECVELLLNSGADVNAADIDNSFSIMFAAQHGYNDIVKLLLAKGADPKLEGKHGLSAIGFAQQNGHKETERILTGKVN